MDTVLLYATMFFILVLNLAQTYNLLSPLLLFSLALFANLVGVINQSNPDVAWAVLLTACASCVGAFLINAITGFDAKREIKYYRSLPLFDNSRKVGFIVWFFFAIYLCAVVLIFRKGVPIFASNVYEARIALRAGSGLLFRILKVFSSLLGMVALLQLQLCRGVFTRMSLVGIILVLLGISFLSGDKMSAIMFAGPIIWVYFYLPSSRFRFLALGILVSILLTIWLTQISHDVDLSGALDVLLYRITIIHTVGLDYIFRAMQPTNGEYMGRDLQFLAGSFGLTERTETIDAYLYRTVFGYSGFTVPPTLTGELYINWGWGGIVLGSFLYGVALQLLYVLLLRSRKSVTTMILIIYCQFMLLYMSQFATIIMTFYFLGIGLLMFGMAYAWLYLWLGVPRGEMKLPTLGINLNRSYTGAKH
jgi:oligosaccharide repeat unit polymerase